MDRTAKTIGYLIAVHVLGMLAMSACRLVLLLANIPEAGIDWLLAGHAMLIGLKFDNLIGCYIAALPCVVLPVLALTCPVRVSEIAAKISSWWFGILYTLVICIEVANARYFHFFENHFTIGITEWFGFVGDTAGMVTGDATNWIFLAIAIVLIALYIPALRAITKNYLSRLK